MEGKKLVQPLLPVSVCLCVLLLLLLPEQAVEEGTGQFFV